MVGRPKIVRSKEELIELEKKRRIKYKKYYQKYSKYYYLKKVLENPDYNRKNNLKKSMAGK